MMDYEYKEKIFSIQLCDGDWREKTGWFHVEGE